MKNVAVGWRGPSGEGLLAHEVFRGAAKNLLGTGEYPGLMVPVHQMGSTSSYWIMLGSGTGAQPFKTVEDYDNWLARGNRMPVLFDTAIDNMREGMEAGVVQPRALMEKVVQQLDELIKDKAEETLLWGPIKSMPGDVSEVGRAESRERGWQSV